MAVVPASLVFLTDLPNLPAQKKVRFLGCVNRYDQPSGCLFLSHQYPGSASEVVARVNIDLVLETIQNIDLQYGAWINVMGFTGKSFSLNSVGISEANSTVSSIQEVFVKAILIWNAGSLKVEDYEHALQARKDCDTTGG